ncbi:hypothetical protein ACQVQT_20230 [Bacillus paranthracis]|uniref:Uncharacterized protein n=3 Tax=Bacillus paranthracis TaxID=2026186 RepID=A0A5M9GK02_9BACI|nr:MULTISPECIES: hypothetical protein [Bacillus]EJP90922.1 hypothetical protein IAU_03666 [Bacillus cereus IS075]EJR04659.1 hypothetical protein II7_05504 [Bacillus cereus MSX-A12]EOO92289.1 hypothetical protein IGS_01171 [Bacillus cereus IS845/00]EOO98425.1 hypothetical protein IGQ_01178 [Bacillus cereus IS195]CKE94844.1 Uncharacterised protein [Streptococcus pneumoniae]
MNILKLVGLHILNSYQRKGYLLKKLLRFKSIKKYIAFSLIFDTCFSLFLVYLLSRFLLPSYETIFVIIALILSTYHVISIVAKSKQQLDKEYLISHFMSYVNDKYTLIKKVIIIDWMVGLFHSLTALIPISFFILFETKEYSYFPLLILVHVTLFSLNLLFKSSAQKKWFSTIIHIILKGVLGLVTYAGASIFINIISITRRNIDLYGYKLKAISNLNDQTNDILTHSSIYQFYKKIEGLYNNYINFSGVAIAIGMLFILSLIVFKYSRNFKDRHFKIKFSDNLYNGLNKDHYYTFADYYTLKNMSTSLKNNPLDLYLTGELAMSIGISLATVQYVHNEILIILIMFFQLHLIFKGVIGTTSHVYSKVFKFEQECSMLSLFNIHDIKKSDILLSKYELLKRTSTLYLLINLLIFLIATILISPKQSLALLIVLLPFLFMKNEYVLYSLRTNFDVFAMLSSEKNPPEISKLNEFNGYTLIATSNNMLSRLIMQFVVLGFILTGTFKLVSGMSWIYILFIVCLAIFIQVIISNRDYKSFKLNKKQ